MELFYHSFNSPLVSLISKNDVNGLPSETNPYLISRGEPLSPSSAWTCVTLSPGNKPEGILVTGGATLKTGGTSWISSTIITTSNAAMLRVSWPGSA